MRSPASVANLEATSLVYAGAAQIRNRATSRSIVDLCSHCMGQPREPCVCACVHNWWYIAVATTAVTPCDNHANRACVRAFTDATKVMPTAGRSVSQLWVSEPC
jgi:hypothetical protein